MSRRRQGHHECAGAQTGASDSPHDEAAADADEVWHPPGTEARPHPAPHRAAGSRRAITGSRIGVGEALKPAIPKPVNAKALTRYELLGDLRPTWAAECHGITLSDEDHAAMAAGIWDRAFHATESAPLSVAGCGSSRGGTPLLLLLDNVPHEWLEGRGSR